LQATLKCYRRLTATVFQVGARRVFPCLDEPMFKATFNITIKHFFFYRALSNMPVNNTITLENNVILTSFDKTPVISTYAVGITLVQFVDPIIFNESLWYYQEQSLKLIRYVVNNIMEHKEWKYPKISFLQTVISPEYPYESREYFRLIFYRYYTLYIM